MFLVRRLMHSLNIEGNRRAAAIIFVESKNNIFEEVSDSITFRGGLAHSTHGGLVAVFFDKLDSLDIVKAAIEIVQKSKALGVRSKLGIVFGDLIVQELPNGLVKYAALGNSLSRAKRLAKVENGIVVGEEVRKGIEKQFRFEKLEPGWMIKGAVIENW